MNDSFYIFEAPKKLLKAGAPIFNKKWLWFNTTKEARVFFEKHGYDFDKIEMTL